MGRGGLPNLKHPCNTCRPDVAMHAEPLNHAFVKNIGLEAFAFPEFYGQAIDQGWLHRTCYVHGIKASLPTCLPGAIQNAGHTVAHKAVSRLVCRQSIVNLGPKLYSENSPQLGEGTP